MDITNRFVLDFALQYARAHSGARILDYGCGAGEVVVEGRKQGADMLGCDVFYGGSKSRDEAEAAGLLGTAVHEMTGGRIPFPDESFDLVANNQVLEHVEDLDSVLAEMNRVLKPGGTVLSIFPSRDVLREGHIGIPLSHRLPKGSMLRLYYTWALRSLGFGTWKEQAPTCRDWALQKLEWIDTYCVYRPRREILDAFARYFSSELREPDYIRYRLLSRPGREAFVRVLDVPVVPAIASAVFRKLAFLVIVSRKVAR